MATVRTVFPIFRAIQAIDYARKGRKKMVIRAETGKALFTVPYAPLSVTHDSLAPTYATSERPGRVPLLERSGEPLPTMSFTLFLGSKNLQQDIDAQLKFFENMSKYQNRLGITGYGTMEAGLWRITSLSISVLQRTVSNHVSRANVDVTFTRASDAAVRVGPVSGGVKPPKSNQDSKNGSGGVKKPIKPAPSKPRYYVVKKGDTLWELAVRYYKDGSKWRKIADANGIRDARTIPVGKKLRIP